MTINGEFVRLDVLKFNSVKEGVGREIAKYRSEKKLSPSAEGLLQIVETQLTLAEKDFYWYLLFSRTYQPSQPMKKETEELAGALIRGLYERVAVTLPTAISLVGNLTMNRPGQKPFGADMIDFGVSIRKHTPHCHGPIKP